MEYSHHCHQRRLLPLWNMTATVETAAKPYIVLLDAHGPWCAKLDAVDGMSRTGKDNHHTSNFQLDPGNIDELRLSLTLESHGITSSVRSYITLDLGTINSHSSPKAMSIEHAAA